MSVNPTPTIGRPRLALGAILFIGGFLSPLLIPFVARSDLPSGWKAALTAGLTVGLPEIGLLLAVAVLGKQGFEMLKARLFSLLRRHTQPAAVSARRYRVGLVMFCLPLLVGWLAPYVARLWPASSLERGPLAIVIGLDLMFAFSFLVLGADFWEKIRRLFIYERPPGDA